MSGQQKKVKAEGYRKMIGASVLGLLVMGVLSYIIMTFVIEPKEYNWWTYSYGDAENEEPYGARFLIDYLKEEWDGNLMLVSDEDSIADILKKKACNVVCLNRGNIDHDMTCLLHDNLNRGGNVIAFCAYNQIPEGENPYPVFVRAQGYNEIAHTDQKIVWKSVYISNDGTKDGDAASWGMKIPDAMIDLEIEGSAHQYKVFDTTIRDSLLILAERHAGDRTFKVAEWENGTVTTLLYDDVRNSLALHARMGRGNMTFLASMAMLSNYMLSNDHKRRCLDHLLNKTFTRGMPVLVIVSYRGGIDEGKSADNNNSAFHVLLNHDETRLAIYLLLAALLLTLIFNTRRRRAARQEKAVHRNSTITYVRHLASLYDRKTDYKPLVQMELRSLLYQLRKEYRFDPGTADYRRPSQFAALIAVKTGRSAETIRNQLLIVEKLGDDMAPVSLDMYMQAMSLLELDGRKSEETEE